MRLTWISSYLISKKINLDISSSLNPSCMHCLATIELQAGWSSNGNSEEDASRNWRPLTSWSPQLGSGLGTQKHNTSISHIKTSATYIWSLRLKRDFTLLACTRKVDVCGVSIDVTDVDSPVKSMDEQWSWCGENLYVWSYVCYLKHVKHWLLTVVSTVYLLQIIVVRTYKRSQVIQAMESLYH